MSSRIRCELHINISPLQTNAMPSRVNERERQALLVEKERQQNAIRKTEGDLHQLQLEESDHKGRLRDKDALERRIEEMKKEQVEVGETLKVSVKVLKYFMISDTGVSTGLGAPDCRGSGAHSAGRARVCSGTARMDRKHCTGTAFIARTEHER